MSLFLYLYYILVYPCTAYCSISLSLKKYIIRTIQLSGMAQEQRCPDNRGSTVIESTHAQTVITMHAGPLFSRGAGIEAIEDDS